MGLIIEQKLLELVGSLNDYLLKIPNGCTKIADLLRYEEKEKANSTIIDFIEGIEWILHTISILKNNNYSILFNEQKLNLLLIELNETIAKGDKNYLADLFEYEIAPFFEENPLEMKKN